MIAYFCKAADIDSDNEYFFIIDEINRGNLSKVFGELFMLIEADKRGIELQLLYSDEKFSIPENVYIIGMMNTADRSLAMMVQISDYEPTLHGLLAHPSRGNSRGVTEK